MADKHNTYRDGKVHVMADKCKTCIFNPHTRPVEGKRVAEMVRGTKDDDGSTVVCHSTLYTGGEEKHAICKGWYDRFADQDTILRLAEAMDVIEFQEETE